MKIKYIALALNLVIGILSQALAVPSKVIIIRHAEKGPKDTCLTLQGLERASALPYYFSSTPLYNTPPISHVFAAYDKSYIRAKQTCAPIAEHLKSSLNINYKPEEAQEVANEILTNPKYDNGNVLLCWSHRYISPLVRALGGHDPVKWSENIFDQVYMLTYEGKEKPIFQQFLQKLMFGDRATFEDKPHPLPPIPVKCPDKR